MTAYVGYSTSLLYWLSHGTDVPCHTRQPYVTKLAGAATTRTELEELDFESLGLSASQPKGWPERTRKGSRAKKPLPEGPVIHVLVPKGADHNRVEGFDRHLWTSRIPRDSFCKLAPDVYLSTPEFSFLQLAGVLSTQQLVLVGYWLCAKYRLQEGALPLEVDPITSVNALQTYLEGANGCYGANKARNALRWVIDGARSPLEAEVAMLVALPVRLGGYGFKKPLINYQLDAKKFDSQTLDRADRSYYEIDLYWKDAHVGLEYDGVPHYDRDQVRSDKRRLNSLLANGERILVVMYDQLVEKENRETLMNQLAKLLHVPLRKASKEDTEARDALNGLLFENEFAL